jgi:murein DD-endopeptidase MepM/ murein hydrolase activator NlpD
MNFRKLRQGQTVTLVRSADGRLKSLHYVPDRDHELTITRAGENFVAEMHDIPSTTDVVTAEGQIRSSLFESVIAAGERPELAVRLADIFAWDLDFYTDPRAGDSFRVVFEKRTFGADQSVSYGRILAAEYVNDGEPYRAVLFHDRAGHPAYYTAEGKALQRAFLRSPLKFAAPVTSHFSMHRFHPILKTYRAHLGTDYAAPVGTPVQAIGHGRVVFAGRKGGDGNMVVLRHANGYETYYLHLSRIFVRRGQTVQQGQRIGAVGATGLATGPHLDFRVQRNGRFMNFEAMKLPPATPVAPRDLAEFRTVRDSVMQKMEQHVIARQTAATAAAAVATAR